MKHILMSLVVLEIKFSIINVPSMENTTSNLWQKLFLRLNLFSEIFWHEKFEDYESIIEPADILLHEDIAANKARKKDIVKDFEKSENKFRIEYVDGKYLEVCCPHCGTESLALESDGKIKCKFCGEEFDNYSSFIRQIETA